MPWSGIMSLCRPTLHDKVLSGRIGGLARVTPVSIRRISRAIAVEGLAGEQAMQAAQTATETDKSDRRITSHQLLAALVRQVNAVMRQSSDVALVETDDLDARARLTIAWLAPHLRQSPTWAVTALDALTDIMAGLGVGGDAGRVPRLISMLRQVRACIADWAPTQRSTERTSCAEAVCSMADITLSLAETALADARAVTEDMIGLLRNWSTDPESVTRLVTRPEWLLDGWEQICLIWNYAPDDGTKTAALAEILEQVPILPVEVSEWGGDSPDLNNVLLKQKPISLNEDWRTGAIVFDLIARNEQLRAGTS
jgi:hypothetical protein